MAETNLITTLEEFEVERKKGIGVVLPPTGRWKEASLESITRFAEGIGDHNPLWIDEEYARKSRFKMITAPPIFPYSVTIGSGVSGNGNIPDRRMSTIYFPTNYAGADWEFFRPIWIGDKICIKEQVGGVVRKVSKRIGPILFCSGLTSFFNQRQELVATMNITMARYLNIGRAMEYNREPKAGTVIEPADALVFERKRRGAETLYWEDVTEGKEIPALKKGTYNLAELYQWTMNVAGGGRSSRARLEAEGSVDLSGGGRVDVEHALKRRNMPGTFDFGAQRISWMSQIVTDWMGDTGTLKKLFTTVRHPNIVGDTNTVYGKTAKKYIDNNEHLVDLDVRVENQAGLDTALGRATVALPSKG
ncbi:MAG: MaoC family dehydratase N-terminal domain-containing protein [Chloroflexota bacterium]